MSEKTEAPTPRRLQEAREEGQVAKSPELGAATALLVGAWLLQSVGPRLIQDLQAIMISMISSLPVVQGSGSWLQEYMADILMRIAPDLAFIVFGLMLTGITVNLAQTGLLFATKKLGFNFSRVNPLEGLKRIFSPNGLFELGKALFKLLIVGWVAYSFLRSRTTDLMGLAQMGYREALAFWANLAISLSLRVGFAYMVLAIIDYIYQRWQYTRSLRMSKEEVKEDFKRSEGDPFIRSRIRGQQRRMARQRMMAAVPRSDVVITNPTHLAVAIRYDATTMNAPRVTAKGAHLVAQKIVEIARRSSVPVVQNIPVARALYRTVDIEQEIPAELYTTLAELLAYVYRLRRKGWVAPPTNRPAAAPPAGAINLTVDGSPQDSGLNSSSR